MRIRFGNVCQVSPDLLALLLAVQVGRGPLRLDVADQVMPAPPDLEVEAAALGLARDRRHMEVPQAGALRPSGQEPDQGGIEALLAGIAAALHGGKALQISGEEGSILFRHRGIE